MNGLFLLWALTGCSGAAKTRASLPACPTTLPRAGTPCTSHVDGGITSICEYGGNEHGQCKTQAWCGDASGALVWSVSEPDAACGHNASECPSSFGTGENGLCPVQSDCSYPDGICSCVPCTTDGGQREVSTWQCRGWSDFDQSCLRATLGKACSGEDGKLCVGCPACGGFSTVTRGAICQEGYWQQFISTACDCAPAACHG